MLGPGEMINHQAMNMFVLWSKSQAVAKLEPLDKLENCLGWMQPFKCCSHHKVSWGSLWGWYPVASRGKRPFGEWSFLGPGCPKQTGYQNVWPASWRCLGQGSGGGFANHHSPIEWSPKWTWNWKMRWWKNTTVWSMKQKPSNLLTFTFRVEPRSCWICSRKISDCSKSGSRWWGSSLRKPAASCSGQSLIRATLAHSSSWSKSGLATPSWPWRGRP